MRIFRRHGPLPVILCALLLLAHPAAAHERVLIFAAASTAPAIERLTRNVSGGLGGKADAQAVFAASGTLARQIANGAPADLFLSADKRWIEMLAESGHIDRARVVGVMRNCLVLVKPRDDRRPLTLSRNLPAELGAGRLLLADPALAPLGAHSQAALRRLGLWETLQARLAFQPNARSVLALAARGEAAAIVYRSGALQSPGLRIVAALPETSPIVYFLAPIRGRDGPAVHRMIDTLTSDAARTAYKQAGFIAVDAQCPS
jgi:molybdate transport system substrate-binding protein